MAASSLQHDFAELLAGSEALMRTDPTIALHCE
jgi:hypothetical protein